LTFAKLATYAASIVKPTVDDVGGYKTGVGLYTKYTCDEVTSQQRVVSMLWGNTGPRRTVSK